MVFNSFEFAVFFPVVFILYWLVAKENLRLQNVILLLASYLFYSWWDYRFTFLLLFSTLLDFYSGLKIHESKDDRARKAWLVVSVLVNLGFLGFFKYCNFFIDSFADLLRSVGLQPNI